MSLARHAKKRDGNEAGIVAALRDAGCLVWLLDRPVDLLVAAPAGWALLEVKQPDGAVRASQWGFVIAAQERGLRAAIVRTVDEAFEAVGLWSKA